MRGAKAKRLRREAYGPDGATSAVGRGHVAVPGTSRRRKFRFQDAVSGAWRRFAVTTATLTTSDPRRSRYRALKRAHRGEG